MNLSRLEIFLLTILGVVLPTVILFSPAIGGDRWANFVIALLTFAISFVFASTHNGIKGLAKKVDLQCNFRPIAKSLEEIIQKITADGPNAITTERAEKRLNGLSYKLKQGSIGRSMVDQVLDRLKRSENSFYATSTFSIEWWLESEWLFYLTAQLILCKGKKDSFMSKRFFVYPLSTLKKYNDEIRFLDELHKLGNTSLILLDRGNLCNKYGRTLNSLQESQKSLLPERISDVDVPDIIMLDGIYAYYRNSMGDTEYTDNNEDLDVYKSWVELLEKAAQDDSIKVPLRDIS